MEVWTILEASLPTRVVVLKKEFLLTAIGSTTNEALSKTVRSGGTDGSGIAQTGTEEPRVFSDCLIRDYLLTRVYNAIA